MLVLRLQNALDHFDEKPYVIKPGVITMSLPAPEWFTPSFMANFGGGASHES